MSETPKDWIENLSKISEPFWMKHTDLFTDDQIAILQNHDLMLATVIRLTARIEELEKANAKLTEFARWRVETAEAAVLGDHDSCRLCGGTGEVGTHEFGPIECPDCIVRDIADMARSTLETGGGK